MLKPVNTFGKHWLDCELMSTHIRKPTKAWRSEKKATHEEDFEALQFEILGLCRCPDCEHPYPRDLLNCPHCGKKTV